MRQVGRALDGGDAEAPHFLGQARLGLRDAVLHELLGLVDIGAEPEGDGQRHQAVGGRLAAHVEHVLDAVDRLLDAALPPFRRSPWGWRRDTARARPPRAAPTSGYSEIGMHPQREQAGEEDQDRQHAGEDRPIDEELGEVHGRVLTRCCRSTGALGSAQRPLVCIRAWLTDLPSMATASGATSAPGRTRCRPLTTMRSPAVRPLVTTRRPSTKAPSVTSR